MLIRIFVLAFGLLRLSCMALIVQVGLLSKYRFTKTADNWITQVFSFWSDYGPKGQRTEWRFKK